MWRFRTVRVAQHERAVWFRDGNLEGILTPGRYRFYESRTDVRKYAAEDAEFVHPALRHVMINRPEVLAPHLKTVELNETQIALTRVNGIAREVIEPGAVVAYWTHAQKVTVDVVDYRAGEAVPESWIRAINLAGTNMVIRGMAAHLQPVSVDRGHSALLLVDGKVERSLGPGRYAFWRAGKVLSVVSVDERPQQLEINGQEILTKDRVSLRVNAALTYRISDSVVALVETDDVEALAYRVVQFALRAAISGLTFDELLNDKQALGDQVQTDVTQKLTELGLTAVALGVKDVILPGEMKDILNRVVEAEKEAEANAVRRRDESASVRALANTARMFESNPGMARLKELEVLASVTAQVENLHVMNGLDGLLNRLLPDGDV